MSVAPEDTGADPPLWRTPQLEPGRVAIVSGLQSFGVVGADGDLAWQRETRGAPFEWGGVYAQGIRLSGAWRITWGPPERPLALGASLIGLTARRSRVESLHHSPEVDLRQQVVIPPGTPGVARRLEFSVPGEAPVRVRVRSEFEPYLSPVLVEGLRPSQCLVQSDRRRVRVKAVGASALFESDLAPGRIELSGSAWTGGSRRTVPGPIVHEFELAVPARGTSALTLLLWGGIDRFLPEDRQALVPGSEAALPWAAQAEAAWSTWVNGTPDLYFPEAPGLEQSYRLARGALRTLYCEHEAGMRGLVAGYPWYATIWGRDLAWMLPAVLWMNDAVWAEDSLQGFFRYQASSTFPLLGATAGELPMQLSAGPVFLYGPSDTTLYYPERCRRLVDHTGDAFAVVDRFAPTLNRLRAWMVEKTDPATGLLTNGGEAEAMRDAVDGVGEVSYGIDAPDTTIWDAADRRDHAVDLQVLGVEAEEAFAALAEHRGVPAEAEEARRRARALTEKLRSAYDWPAEGYLYDSLRKGGAAVDRVRPNALLAVIAGLLDPEKARRIVERAAQPDLSTPWGVRTLSERDPTYDPQAYHDGQVWPIATAWAARAALEVGAVDLGMRYLDILARIFREEGGLANECYRGDAPVPWDSCVLLGFSVAPFLTTLFEGLWGLRPEMGRSRLTVRPRFPEGWKSARIENVRLGDGTLTLGWERGTLSARWTGTLPLTLAHPGGETTLPPYSARVL